MAGRGGFWYGLLAYPLAVFWELKTPALATALGLPCPTTIFTFGCFLLQGGRLPSHLLIIPSLWSLAGVGAALSFGITQDLLMPAAALSANVLLLAYGQTPPKRI